MAEELTDFTPPDDALVEIRELIPGIAGQDMIYVYWRSLAIPPREACKRAGMDPDKWRSVETRPTIRQAIEELNEAMEPDYKVTRKRVQAIILEGIEIARRKDQAKTMIEGAVALAGIAGLNAPQRLQIEQRTQHVHSGDSRVQTGRSLAHLPRSELEAILKKQRTLPPPKVIEAEYVEITEISTD
jgi:hypothetical protein